MFEETNGRLRQSQSIFDSLDNVNFSKEIGFPPVSYLAKNDLAESFKGFWDEANRHGSHIIAFYDSMNRLKASAIPVGDFRFKVGYHLNSDEKNNFLGNMARMSKKPEERRAFLADNLTISAWFRPFEAKK